MKMIFNLFFVKYLLVSFNFKALFYLLYNFFYSIFFTKSSFLFGFNVGWNINFLNIFNFIKMIVIFIWEKLTTLIYPLKLFSSLFGFLIEGLKVFISINDKLLELLKNFSNLLEVVTKLTLTSLAAVVSTAGLTKIFSALVSAIPVVGTSVKAFFDELSEKTYLMLSYTVNIFSKIVSFIFNIFVLVINGLFKIVLRILDIMVIVLNIWLLLLKKVIMILGFVCSFLMSVTYLCAYENKE
ncbi:MAG: hypothetical protein PR2021_0700 [Candidatus Phytoplasma pruni]|nr:MAG: hypothetical protein PR2021_0700 [Candidatus Phytoplasma pruni]